MTDAPKRIWSERFWQNGDKWGHAGLEPESEDQEYFRADIADEMLDAIKEFCCRVEVGEIRSKKTYAKFTAIIDKVESEGT